MRLTTMTDYAMRMLMYVAQHPDRLCTIAEIAKYYGVSEPHLMKITHKLAQHGWLETVRGKHGGMRLARPPREINLGAILRDMENDFALVECLDGGSHCILADRCGLTGVVQGALQQFMRHFEQYTLADIMPQDPAAAAPLTQYVKLENDVFSPVDQGSK
ncbi:RrF2 family transcriptional regulator [Parapusillimonas granuli]|uniref:Rrf2 family transcriptional regulator n=1 Tax=Parapusillimonas granuli TaxID=380911 RepID=A0A853FXF6_9BURK|nr:Rrf2 family transcriptional regulator [Parapusillimonas granuli]MBB5215211.1 Rrf2 family nitric oxide-sensitive transcriptional repressor [Parapusillimonas granuli]MEB2401799.1 Rrf2 family transcriptional regulator [Alcaligenaceae bacterium]NYT49528.1 Rrf2 family transcriptional regulator [Parapusillimonas granuli]